MILGEKTYLQAVLESSLEPMRCWRNDPVLRENFREFRELSEKDQENWFEKKLNGDPSWIGLEIRCLKSIPGGPGMNELVGYAGLQYINWHLRSAEFGVYIANTIKFRKHGLGTDALRSLVRYGFEEVGLHKIWCEVFEFNAAIKVYEKVGFKIEGILRDNCFKSGKYWNTIVMSMLDREYKESHDGKASG